MIKVYNCVKLPLKICKGSVKDRKALAENMIIELDKRISPIFEQDEIKLNKIKKIIKKVLPCKNINFIVTYIKNYCDQVILNCGKSNNINEYVISLKANNNKISKNEKNTLYHESWHFFDHICNPKMLSRIIATNEDAFTSTQYFYQKYLYTKKNYKLTQIEKELKTLLDEHDDSNRINILQLLRNELTGEYYAFNIAEKYAPEPETKFASYKFDKKLEFINNKLKEELYNQRKCTGKMDNANK